MLFGHYLFSFVITIDEEGIENVNNFDYLGARIEANGKSTPEIRRLAIAGSKLRKTAKSIQ